MKYLIYIITFILMLSVVFAVEPSFYFKVNDNISINIPCFQDDNYCPTTSTCNISINYPNTDAAVVNSQMINNIPYRTYYFTNATILGDYQAIVGCYNGTESGYSIFTFQVNNLGRKIENVLPMLLFFVLILTIVFVLLYFTVVAGNPMMLPLMFLATFSISWTLFFVYMNTISMNRIYYVLFWMFNLVSVGIFFVVMWYATTWAIDNFSQRGKRRKLMGDNLK